jgi:hypothetical protein
VLLPVFYGILCSVSHLIIFKSSTMAPGTVIPLRGIAED